MWRLYCAIILLNMIVIIVQALRIHKLEQEQFEMISEFIKEINKLRNGENKNVK